MGGDLRLGKGRRFDCLYWTGVVELHVNERGFLLLGHGNATQRRRNVGIWRSVNLIDPFCEVLLVRVLRSCCGEHPPSLCIHCLKIVQLRRPCRRHRRRGVRQCDNLSSAHGPICDVCERDGGSTLTVRRHARKGSNDWKVHVAVGDLRQRPPCRKLIISARHQVKKRTRNDREPRSVKHEERVRVEPTRQVQRGAEARSNVDTGLACGPTVAVAGNHRKLSVVVRH